MSENLSVLKGEGKTGNFVHESQVMGKVEGFRNVSKIWLDKTMSYEQGFELLAKHRLESEDILCSVQDMVPTVTDGQFAFLHRPTERYFRPTPFAMGKVGAWADTGSWYVQHMLGEAPMNSKGEPKYTRDLGDAETLANVVRNGFRRIDQNKEFLFRVNRTSGLLRTMMSDRYACINNDWFLESLQKILPGGRLSHWDRSDEETIFGNVLIPDSIRKESDSDYGGMLSVSNSQIGERDIHTLPSVFRAICRNGCIWDQKAGTAFRRRHVGKIDLDKLFMEIKNNLEAQIPLLPQGIEKLLGTRRLRWDGGSVLPLFAAVAGEYKLSKKQATAALEAFNVEVLATDKELQTSLFGVINAITRSGQKADKSADWVRLDTVGGSLSQLDSDDWANLTSYAKKLKPADVEAAFVLAS